MPTDYANVFGQDERAVLRMMHLSSMFDLRVVDVPYFRDAWIEFHQNPDREPNVGTLYAVFYTQSNGVHRDPAAVKVFTLRAHPQYRFEEDDTFALEYTAFYLAVPADLDPEILSTLRSVAVEPVDRDARWKRALGAL